MHAEPEIPIHPEHIVLLSLLEVICIIHFFRLFSFHIDVGVCGEISIRL